MKPNVIWEIDRADLDWLPASWPELVEAFRRRGLSTSKPLEDLLDDADRDGRRHIEVQMTVAGERSRLAGERSDVLTVVATAQRRRELEDAGHVGPVAVVPFSPPDDRPIGANSSDCASSSPVAYGCLTPGLSGAQIEELIRLFATAFDRDDNVRLTLFGSAESAFCATEKTVDSLAREHLPFDQQLNQSFQEEVGVTRLLNYCR